MQQDFKSLEGCWQNLTWWAYEYITTSHPQYIDLSLEIYLRAYAWSLCTITKVGLT